MTLQIQPTGYRVIVKQEQIEKTTKAGIILHSVDEEKRQQKGTMFGTLVAIGPQAWKDERLGSKNWANIGDRVMFNRYAGHRYEQAEDGSYYHVMNDEDILAVIPNKN